MGISFRFGTNIYWSQKHAERVLCPSWLCSEFIYILAHVLTGESGHTLHVRGTSVSCHMIQRFGLLSTFDTSQQKWFVMSCYDFGLYRSGHRSGSPWTTQLVQKMLDEFPYCRNCCEYSKVEVMYYFQKRIMQGKQHEMTMLDINDNKNKTIVTKTKIQ